MNIKEELKKQGFSASITTRRYLIGEETSESVYLEGPYKMESIRDMKLTKRISPCGGEVDIRVTNDKTGEAARGVALCSIQDNFSKKEGILIAVGRAVAQLTDKPEDVSFLG